MVVAKDVVMRLIIVMVAMVMVMVKTTPSCVGSVAACVLVPPPADQHSMLLPTHSAMPEKGSCLPLHHKRWYIRWYKVVHKVVHKRWYIPWYGGVTVWCRGTEGF